MGRTERVSAILVGHTDYGESDRIVRLLTPERGKISAMARGARKSKKRYGGALDLGNRIEMMLVSGRGKLPLAGETRLVRGTGHLRDDLGRLALLHYVCEWVDSLARENHPEPKLFGVLDVALAVLEASTEMPSPVFRWGLEAKALTFAGLTPVLMQCASCGRPLDNEAVYLASAGGVLHPDCGFGVALAPGWWDQVHGHLEWHLGRSLKSRALLMELEGGRLL